METQQNDVCSCYQLPAALRWLALKPLHISLVAMLVFACRPVLQWLQIYFKMATMTYLFVLYMLNNYIVCCFMAWNVRVVALPMYLGIWVIVGANIDRNYICSFQETECL